MTGIMKFLILLATTYGYWYALLFVLVSLLPLAIVGYIIFSSSKLGGSLDKRWSEKIEEERELHKLGHRVRKEFTQKAQEVLQELAEETGADRALIFEYSNGTTNLIGLPFVYMSVTGEVVTPGTKPLTATHQKLNTSILGTFLAKLEEEGHLFFQNRAELKEEFGFFADFMLRRNISSALFYNLQGVDQTIGFLVIMTIPDSRKELDKEDSLTAMAKAAQKISTLINFTELTKRSKAEKTKWWLWWKN